MKKITKFTSEAEAEAQAQAEADVQGDNLSFSRYVLILLCSYNSWFLGCK